MATKPAPVASSKPAPEARRVFVAKDTLAPEDGIPVAPDMKSYPNTTAFLAANRLFRSKVATAWSRNQIDAATYHKLMATYRANIQAGKVAGR